MYIPKMRIVDAEQLSEESCISCLNYDLKEYFSDFHQSFFEDHIRSWRDDDWDYIPRSMVEAYEYLCRHEGFRTGDSFIWSVSAEEEEIKW